MAKTMRIGVRIACPNLRADKASRTRYKCTAYGTSGSAATDWARRCTACGLYGEPLAADHVPLIKRLKSFEPPDGYFLAFSGGKDSQCVFHLCKLGG